MRTAQFVIIFLLCLFTGNAIAQQTVRTAREMGIITEGFSNAGFIYKGGANPEKNRHFRLSLNNIQIRRISNKNDYRKSYNLTGNLTLRAGTEKRHTLNSNFQFIRGIQFSSTFLMQRSKTTYIDFHSGPPYSIDEEYDIALGLHYLLGFRYDASSRVAFSLEAMPGFIWSTQNNAELRMSTGSIYLTATCLLQKKVKDSK